MVIVLTVLILAGKCETSPAVPELVVCSQSRIDILAQKGRFFFFFFFFHVCVELMKHRRGLETYSEVKL